MTRNQITIALTFAAALAATEPVKAQRTDTARTITNAGLNVDTAKVKGVLQMVWGRRIRVRCPSCASGVRG